MWFSGFNKEGKDKEKCVLRYRRLDGYQTDVGKQNFGCFTERRGR